MITLVPNRVSLAGMLLGTLFWGPLHFAISLIVERFAQRLLRPLRGFEASDHCARCGYCIRHLVEPRCPECKTAFNPAWLDPNHEPPRATVRPWRSRLLAMGLAAICLLTPFGFHESVITMSAWRGANDAERDWANANPVLYSDLSDFGNLHNNFDPQTGLRIRRIRGGLVDRTYQEAYSAVVRERLSEYGAPPRPSFVLTVDEAKALLRGARMLQVEPGVRPIGKSSTLRVAVDDLTIDSNGSSFQIASISGKIVRIADLKERGGITCISIGNSLYTFATSGEILQTFDFDEN